MFPSVVRHFYKGIVQISNKCTVLQQIKPNVCSSHKNVYQNVNRSIYTSYSLFNLKTATQETVLDTMKEDEKTTKEVVSLVNNLVASKKEGRLFAVVHVMGKQFKITTGDLIIIEGSWAPTVGDKISLDKVLCVGGTEFSLIGRPIVQPGIVTVKATVIQKDFSHIKPTFRKKRRKQYQRLNFNRIEQTMLRINSIEMNAELNNYKDIEGVEGKIF